MGASLLALAKSIYYYRCLPRWYQQSRREVLLKHCIMRLAHPKAIDEKVRKHENQSTKASVSGLKPFADEKLNTKLQKTLFQG